MRKGTKSCLECRRRKIKCTFEPGRTQICNECYARGSTCIDQEHGDIQSYTQQTVEQSSYSLRERVTQLEGLVKQVLHRLPEGQEAADSPQSRSQVDAQAAEVLKSLKTSHGPMSPSAEGDNIFLPGGIRSEAPALSLFDNDVIARKESQPTLSRAQYNKNKTLISALTQMLPSPHDLEIILESSHEWWVIWRKMFPEIADKRCETMKESVSHSLRSDKPAEIAKIMLCIAISIHQMPDGFDWGRLHLKESRSQLMDKYISTVDKLIVSDDEIAATIDGIECMVLEAKYQVNMGRPRRAWLLYHRAIAFCQLLGFHPTGEPARQVGSRIQATDQHLGSSHYWRPFPLTSPWNPLFCTRHLLHASGQFRLREECCCQRWRALCLPYAPDRHEDRRPESITNTVGLFCNDETRSRA